MNENELRNKINELKGKRECFHKRELLKAELKGYFKAKEELRKIFKNELIGDYFNYEALQRLKKFLEVEK
jgi:hypothetical protein